MANHTSGAVRLAHKDTSQVVVYQPANPASLEPFCLSCHDSNGANGNMSPFTGGNTLGAGRNVAGNKIAGYWNSTYKAHRSNGLTCAGTGSPNTGCHGNNRTINMHGSSSRGLLAQNMTYPISPTAPYNYNDYRLCFDCHASYPAVTKEVVLGYRLVGNYDLISTLGVTFMQQTPYPTSSIQSLFRDQYTNSGAPFDNRIDFVLYNFMPLHNYHLLGTLVDPLVPALSNLLTVNYRNDVTQQGRVSCTTCHNVHGTNSAVRSTYDSLFLTRGAAGPNLFSTLPFFAAVPASLFQSYPTNCTADCHSVYATPANNSDYWYSPANE
jgi:hypothetical protein